MKNFTLLILLFLCSFSGYSQLEENFDAAPAAPVAGGVWTLPSGNWTIFDNGVGTSNWRLNTGAFPAYSVPNAAFINTQNIGQGNTAIDYLATPLVTMPTNPQLRFQTRMTIAGNQQTIYQIRAAPATSDPTLPASYTTLIAEFTETDLSVPSNVNTYLEKVVPIPASVGPSAYIAFVRVYTQPDLGLDGDRWLVDDVRIVQQCLDPTGLTATGITQTSANLSWVSPGSATQWEIEIIPLAATPTGSGTVVSTNNYTATATTTPVAPFTPSTQYKYYVRALCADNINSAWVGPFAFSTSSPGLSCSSPIIIGATPYSTTDNTGNYADNTDVAQPATCAGTTANYMTGNEVFYSYTPTVSGAISITMTPTGTYSGIFVYQGCANVGVSCLAGVANSGATIREIPNLAVTAGVEYIIVISTNATPQTVAYSMVIQTLNCAPPTGLTATGTGPNSANLSWDAGTATSWEVAVQTAGSAIPSGAGDTTTVNTNYSVTQLTGSGAGLVLGTPYQYWVRADCGDGTFSPWAGPYLFNTTSCTSGCNFTFVMTDSYGDGWNNNTMDVIQDGLTIATIGPTFTTGAGPVTVSVPMCAGPFQLFWNSGGSFATEVGISIVNSFGQTVYTRPPSTNAQNSLLYSGIVNCEFPDCLPPTNLTATAVTTNGASLNWTPNGTVVPVSWEIYAVTTGSPVPTAATVPTVTIPGTTTLPYLITGLLADTQYTYYVRAVCSTPGTNNWSAPSAPFTTLPTCPKPTALTATAITQTSALLGWTAGGSETAWEIIILDPSAPAPTATDPNWQPATNPVTITTFTPGTSYVYYVRAVCSPTDSSTPAGPRGFTTLQVPAVLPYIETFEGDTQLVVSNGTQVNKWIVGTAVSNGGTHSLYVTNDNGVSNAYTTNTTSVVHAYRDLQMPAVSGDISVSFDWRTAGESVYDYIRVWLVPTTFTPTPGTLITAAASGGVQLGGNLNQQATWQTANYVVSTAAFVGQTRRLIFEWRNDGSAGTQPPGAVDNIQVTALTCPRPTLLTSANISQSSAVLGWTENGTATSWEVFIVPQGSPAPNATSTGDIVSVNPVLMTGLIPGQAYTFYVRAICATDDISIWSVGANFTTLPANDDCSGAIFAPVNSNAVCSQTVAGTLFGATASAGPVLAPCLGNANNDVWYQFIATNSYLNIALLNVVGTTTNLNHAVYSGTCDNLTLLHCSVANSLTSVANNLTVGNTYYIRVYSNGSTAVNTTFNLCISTPSTCGTSSTVCNANYGNTVGVTTLGQIGCLFTTPNPTFFTIQVQTTGPINYFLSQASNGSPTPNLDVDYAAWGPFTSQGAGCTAISGGLAPNAGCSYSAAATENFNIPNAQAGQFYIILITNYSNQAGNITLTQTNAGNPGAGETICCSEGNFSYLPASFCTTSTVNPIPVIAPGSIAGTFSASGTGLVFVDTATGEINLAASAPGVYVITNTIAATDSCGIRTFSYTVTITAPVNATISYSAATYCSSETALQMPTFTGTTGGFYAVSPPGLFIDTTTGAITPSASAPGMYTISYNLIGAGACANSAATFQIEILSSPIVVDPADVTVCGSYQLPVLALGNYFTGAAGSGTALFAGDVIDQTQVVYVYAVNGICSDEESFTVTINTAPALDPVSDVYSCSAYTLPALTAGSYYSAPGGVGPIDPSVPITTTQTIYVYGINGTCSSEVSFTVTVGIFQVTAPADVTVCDTYTLPVLALGDYYTMSGGSGSMMSAGDVVTQTMTLYVYAADGTCTSEEQFTVTVAPAVADAPANVDACTDYTLPALSAGNAYYTATGGPTGSGTEIPVNTVINTLGVTTIYVYAVNGLCTAENMFTVTIGDITADILADVTSCDTFTLAPLSANNNYFTGPNGSGTMLPAGTAITTAGVNTIHIWAELGNCNDQSIFTVTINATPVVVDMSDVTACDSYTLPNLTVGNYYTGPGGTGTQLAQGSAITTDNTLVYIYAETATTPNCVDEDSFTVFIVASPVVNDISDVISCASYTLPAIVGDGDYFTGAGGTGNMLLANDVITSSQTIYVFSDNGTCSDEDSFVVNITGVPEFTITADCDGNAYVLSANMLNGSYDPALVTYAWSSVGGQVVSGIDTANATVNGAGMYTLTITNAGCPSISVPYDVTSSSCIVQKGISANNDGVNDCFELNGFNVTQLQIFNRYGMKVFQQGNYTDQWCGQSDKGDDLPDGTYYYVIERSDAPTTSGWIYLTREY